MQNVKLLVGVLVGTLVLVLVLAVLFSRQDGGEGQVSGQVADEALVEGEERHVSYGLPGGRLSEVAGGVAALADAEQVGESGLEGEESTDSGDVEIEEKVVSVVEFSDFACPACRAARPLVRQILAQYGEKVKFGYRHFPLESIHKNARQAAIASEAASELDMFWEFHDLMFERQDEWTDDDGVVDRLVGLAGELGLDGDEFRRMMERSDLEERVDGDIADGKALGVNSTPTFYVDGERVPVSALRGVVLEKVEAL